MRNLRALILILVFPIFWGACQKEEIGGGEPEPFVIYYMYINEENGGPYQFESEEWVKENIESFHIKSETRIDYDSLYFYEGAFIFEHTSISNHGGTMFFKHPNNKIDTIQYHWDPLYENAPDWTTRKLTHTFKDEIISELDFNNDKSLIQDFNELILDIENHDIVNSKVIIKIPYQH